MVYPYFLILILAYYCWRSTKINTDNALKLFALGLFAVGAIVTIYCINNNCGNWHFISDAGIAFYLLSEVQHAYFRKRNERKTDKATA